MKNWEEALKFYEEGIKSFLLAMKRMFSFVSEPVLIAHCLKSLILHGAMCVICYIHHLKEFHHQS